MIIEAELAWLFLLSLSFLFGSLFLFVVSRFLFHLHESVAIVLDDVLVTVVIKKKGLWRAEDRGTSLNEGVLHQIRAAQTDLNNSYLIIWDREMHHSAC